MNDHFDEAYELNRFITGQNSIYRTALDEIKIGKKKSCWMWFIFPQLRGLGKSRKSYAFGIEGMDEARSYLAHPVLGPRLIECCEALLLHADKSAAEIFGKIDSVKLCSSMTLFALASEENSVFHKVLHAFCDGEYDEQTLKILHKEVIQ